MRLIKNVKIFLLKEAFSKMSMLFIKKWVYMELNEDKIYVVMVLR